MHTCHWPGCDKSVPPKLWGCYSHWYALPKFLRDAIWKHYVPGQEITKTPSKRYLEVARAVQLWIETRKSKIEDRDLTPIEVAKLNTLFAEEMKSMGLI